jgi:hypothetical protein
MIIWSECYKTFHKFLTGSATKYAKIFVTGKFFQEVMPKPTQLAKFLDSLLTLQPNIRLAQKKLPHDKH